MPLHQRRWTPSTLLRVIMVAAVVTVVVTVTAVIPANQLAMRCPANTMLMRRRWPLFWPGAESDVHCCAVALPRLSCLREVRSGAAGGRLPPPLAGSRTMQQGSGKGMSPNAVAVVRVSTSHNVSCVPGWVSQCIRQQARQGTHGAGSVHSLLG